MSLEIGKLALKFLYFRDQLKIYHWQTQSYPRHLVSDQYVNKITASMDLFIETIQGVRNTRLKIPSNTCKFSNETDSSIVKVLFAYRNFVEKDVSQAIKKKETELLNLRDDMLNDINQALYLFTFK